MRVLLMLLCLLAGQAWAVQTDVYAVASGGLSSGTCSTPATACTLTRASGFCAGNHVWLAGGTYTTGLRCVGNGTGPSDSLRTIYEALTDREGSNPVIIDGFQPNRGVDSIDATVIYDHNYMAVRGMIIKVQEVAGTGNRYGVRMQNVPGSEFTDNEVYYPTDRAALAANTQQWGVYVQGTGVKVNDNYIHDVNTGINLNTDTAIVSGEVLRNRIRDLLPGDAEDADCINVGATLRDLAFGIRVDNNDCAGYRDDGIDTFGASHVLVRFNKIGDPEAGTQTTNSCIKAGRIGSDGNVFIGNSCIHASAHPGTTQYGFVANDLINGRIEGNIFAVQDIAIDNATYGGGGGTGADNNSFVNNTAIGGIYGMFNDTSVASSTQTNNYFSGGTYDLYTSAGDTVTGSHNRLLHNTSGGSGTYTSSTDTTGAPGFKGGESPNTDAGFCLNSDSTMIGAGTYIGAYILGYGGESLTNPPPIGARGLCQSRRAAGLRRTRN